MSIVRKGHSPPCTKARRGGRAMKKEVAKPPLIARTGWFSDRDQRKTTPSVKASPCRARAPRASASVASRHFLMTQTPLLALVQGGEIAHSTLPANAQTPGALLLAPRAVISC